MKLITKIQSFSDIITNSSSEVFVVKASTIKELSEVGLESGCITFESIDYDWILNNCIDEWELICSALDIDKKIYGELKESWWYWALTKEDEWRKYVEDNILKYYREASKDMYI